MRSISHRSPPELPLHTQAPEAHSPLPLQSSSEEQTPASRHEDECGSRSIGAWDEGGGKESSTANLEPAVATTSPDVEIRLTSTEWSPFGSTGKKTCTLRLPSKSMASGV